MVNISRARLTNPKQILHNLLLKLSNPRPGKPRLHRAVRPPSKSIAATASVSLIGIESILAR